ncbi:MAG: dihydrolipoamide dehydrogenase [Gammaproteobacteria bacterium]|jgi:dihydrolipoamide dehydrogenase
MQVDLVVIGSGPGGYSAAFRAADLGLNVALVERDQSLGGVCLNVGCIPSKALLHAAKVVSEVREMEEHGLSFGEPRVDLKKLVGWKSKIVSQLTSGLGGLAKQRQVAVVHGVATFASPNTLRVASSAGDVEIEFKNAIVAVGSEPVALPGFPNDDDRLIDSTGALELTDIPERMLVIGGGIIGLEMATVYMELGSAVTVVELLDQIMTGADRDMVKPLEKRMKKKLAAVYTGTKVTKIEAQADALVAHFEGKDAPQSAPYDKILLAVGRRPNGGQVGLENAGVNVDERGFIAVDDQQRTNVSHIFAIGDVVGQPMLAHKAVHEAKVAAEVIAGHKVAFNAKVIPSVAYTDPEVAWAGLTETEAKANNIAYEKGAFPWAASGRSLTLGRNEGITKLLFDPNDGRVIGAGIVGPNAGDLIAEAALAIEMGSDAEDIALTIHPHPTLSETVAMAAEAYAGTITDLYMPKKAKK